MASINKNDLQIFIDDNFIGYRPSDLLNIKEIVYDDAWHDYEESSGLFVFKGFDDNLYYVNYGHCVMTENPYFKPTKINKNDVLNMINEKEQEILEFNYKKNLI